MLIMKFLSCVYVLINIFVGIGLISDGDALENDCLLTHMGGKQKVSIVNLNFGEFVELLLILALFPIAILMFYGWGLFFMAVERILRLL